MSDEEMTRYSFPVSSEPIPLDWIELMICDVLDAKTIPFKRELDQEGWES